MNVVSGAAALSEPRFLVWESRHILTANAEDLRHRIPNIASAKDRRRWSLMILYIDHDTIYRP